MSGTPRVAARVATGAARPGRDGQAVLNLGPVAVNDSERSNRGEAAER